MPYCINDTNATYNGVESSPKGRGYCAHAEKVGTKMRGLDRKVWIIKEYDGKKRWVLYDPRPSILINKLLPHWKKLANGGLLAICANSTYKIFEPTDDADTKHIWKGLENNFTVDAIIWSAPTQETLINFVRYIINNCSDDRIDKLVESKDILTAIVKSYDKYFEKYAIRCKKDYTFKQDRA